MTQPGSAYRPPPAPIPFAGRGKAIEGAAAFLALQTQPLLRRKIGKRLLTIPRIAGMTAFQLLVSWWGNVHFSFSLFGGVGVRSSHDPSQEIYALFVWLPLAVYQRVQRWREEKRGAEPHTFWAGDGHWYSFIPLPDKYVDMLVDPLVAFLAGLVVARLGFGILGFWTCVSACSLFVVEKIRYADARNKKDDLGDMDKEARWNANYMRNKPKGGQSEALAGGAVIPTGNDAEIEAQIERRRMEKLMNTGVDNEIR
jgi:hypothetical protein